MVRLQPIAKASRRCSEPLFADDSLIFGISPDIYPGRGAI